MHAVCGAGVLVSPVVLYFCYIFRTVVGMPTRALLGKLLDLGESRSLGRGAQPPLHPL